MQAFKKNNTSFEKFGGDICHIIPPRQKFGGDISPPSPPGFTPLL